MISVPHIFMPHYNVESYVEEIDRVKTWIQDRTTWIDENISKIGEEEIIIEDISQLSNSNAFKLYTNPVNSNLTMQINCIEPVNISVKLINALGQQFSLDEQECVQGSYSKTWNIKELGAKPGVYQCLVLLNNKQLKVLKLVVQ